MAYSCNWYFHIPHEWGRIPALVLKEPLFLIPAAALTVGFYLYIKFILIGINPSKRYNLDSSTTGKIVSIRQSVSHHYGEGDSYSYVPMVEYVVNGQVYISENQVTSIRNGLWEYGKEEDMVEVFYDSQDPNRFYAVPPNEVYERGRLEMIIRKYIFPICIMAGLFMLYGSALIGEEKFFGLFK